MSVLEVQNLTVEYDTPEGDLQAVRDVNFSIREKNIVGLLGESGCGKSTLAKSLINYLPENGYIKEGKVLLDGEDIVEMSRKNRKKILWNDVAFIPQNAMNCLDPVVKLKHQLIEPVLVHTPKSHDEAMDRAKEVLDIVGIDPSYIDVYPHQLRGGMKHRVVVSMALILEPQLIIADEPTTGLDVLVRDKILNDLERFRDEFDVSIIFISHDIADLVETCNLLMVMYGGKIVEKGPSRILFDTPTHPYTIGLKNALPNINSSPKDLVKMEMNPPDLRSPPEGCCFVNRCPFAVSECEKKHPSFQNELNGVESACYRADEADKLRKESKEVSWVEENEPTIN